MGALLTLIRLMARTGPREERQWIEMDQGVCVSVCACWTEDVEVNEEWAQKKKGWCKYRWDKKLWRAKGDERERRRMRRAIARWRSLYQPECTFRRDWRSRKEVEEGSAGTLTKSEKVKERYIIWSPRKQKAKGGKGQRRLYYTRVHQSYIHIGGVS